LESGDPNCSICSDEFNTPIILDCQHIFCNECISRWFLNEKTCPICRKEHKDAGNFEYYNGSTNIGFSFF
jgi:E3 ubiquitin-protein ligase RNFT1